MELGRVGIDGAEPSGRWRARRGEQEHEDEVPASRNHPAPVDPIPPAPSVRIEAFVDGLVPDPCEVDGHRRPSTAASRRLTDDVSPRPRVLQVVWPHGDHGGSAANRRAALEFFHREVHAATEQRLQRLLHTTLANQSDEVPVLAAGPLEQLSIGAPPVIVDRASRERQEVRLALLEATTQDRSRLLNHDGAAKERRKLREETHSGGRISQGDHERSRTARSVARAARGGTGAGRSCRGRRRAARPAARPPGRGSPSYRRCCADSPTRRGRGPPRRRRCTSRARPTGR